MLDIENSLRQLLLTTAADWSRPLPIPSESLADRDGAAAATRPAWRWPRTSPPDEDCFANRGRAR